MIAGNVLCTIIWKVCTVKKCSLKPLAVSGNIRINFWNLPCGNFWTHNPSCLCCWSYLKLILWCILCISTICLIFCLCFLQTCIVGWWPQFRSTVQVCDKMLITALCLENLCITVYWQVVDLLRLSPSGVIVIGCVCWLVILFVDVARCDFWKVAV